MPGDLSALAEELRRKRRAQLAALLQQPSGPQPRFQMAPMATPTPARVEGSKVIGAILSLMGLDSWIQRTAEPPPAPTVR